MPTLPTGANPGPAGSNEFEPGVLTAPATGCSAAVQRPHRAFSSCASDWLYPKALTNYVKLGFPHPIFDKER